MTKDDVRAALNAFSMNKTNRAIQIICDNGYCFNVSSDCINLDDTNERLLAVFIDSSSSAYAMQRQIKLLVTEYEHIQYITCNVGIEDFEKVLESAKTAGFAIDQEWITNSVKYIGDIMNKDKMLSHKDYLPIDLDRGGKPVSK